MTTRGASLARRNDRGRGTRNDRVSGRQVKMSKCRGFKTFKERGEWVELVFMARAVRLGFRITKPWGDSAAYGVEAGERTLRVQVKSTDCRV
jgi:hypothetical protein